MVQTEICSKCGSIIKVVPFSAECKNCGYVRKFKKGQEEKYGLV